MASIKKLQRKYRGSEKEFKHVQDYLFFVKLAFLLAFWVLGILIFVWWLTLQRPDLYSITVALIAISLFETCMTMCLWVFTAHMAQASRGPIETWEQMADTAETLLFFLTPVINILSGVKGKLEGAAPDDEPTNGGKAEKKSLIDYSDHELERAQNALGNLREKLEITMKKLDEKPKTRTVQRGKFYVEEEV